MELDGDFGGLISDSGAIDVVGNVVLNTTNDNDADETGRVVFTSTTGLILIQR